ncbi:MAG: hypothetical protein K1W16_08610 [Lachnospiraceae bacterium]
MIAVNPKNLEAEMTRASISRKNIADLIGCSYRTIHSRFNGEQSWTYEECVTIRDELFPQMTLEYLFPYEKREART